MGHSGILTLPIFSLRFQTNRGRANRFRTVFTKQYFVPSDTPEDPELTGCDPDSDDLTQRCTCRDCHQLLEPLAANWAMVSEAGSALMSDRSVFPIYQPECDQTLSPQERFRCSRFYVTDEGQQNPGVLISHQYAYVEEGEEPEAVLSPLHYQIYQNLEAGPRGAAQKIIDSGEFHAAMVQHLFEHFMGREMNFDAGDPNNEVALFSTLTDEFKAHDNFKTMVKRIVMLDQYRSVR